MQFSINPAISRRVMPNLEGSFAIDVRGLSKAERNALLVKLAGTNGVRVYENNTGWTEEPTKTDDFCNGYADAACWYAGNTCHHERDLCSGFDFDLEDARKRFKPEDFL